MDTATLATKIERIRRRLEDIEHERAELPPGNFARRSELLDEEHTLQARLGELQDEAAEAGVGLAEKKAGVASNYERVPEIPSNGEIPKNLEVPPLT